MLICQAKTLSAGQNIWSIKQNMLLSSLLNNLKNYWRNSRGTLQQKETKRRNRKNRRNKRNRTSPQDVLEGIIERMNRLSKNSKSGLVVGSLVAHYNIKSSCRRSCARCPAVKCPTRWSLLFIFGFLYWSYFTSQITEKYSKAMC